MNKVISFISGKEYSLADLFGGDTKIIGSGAEVRG